MIQSGSTCVAFQYAAFVEAKEVSIGFDLYRDWLLCKRLLECHFIVRRNALVTIDACYVLAWKKLIVAFILECSIWIRRLAANPILSNPMERSCRVTAAATTISVARA